MKKILLFFISVLFCVSLYAQTFRPDEQELKKFYCKITDSDKKEVSIASDRNITGHIVIPEKITHKEVTYFVTSVAEDGFKQAEMTAITIPSFIKAIGKDAFHQCKSLTEIIIAADIEKIEENTFRSCTSLTEIVLPNSIKSIERRAFYSCSNLESINLPDGLIYLGDEVFSFCSKLKTVSIPKSVTTIPEGAFASCSGLENIELHEGIVSIGNRAFLSCRKLKDITLGESITSIGNDAFKGCSLNEIELPATLISLGERVFMDCKSLVSLTIPASVTSIGDNTFANCIKLNDLYSESKIAPEIGTDVFDGTSDDLIIHVLYNATGYTVENGWTATISYDLGDYVFERENLIYSITNYGKKEVSVRANVELIEDVVVIPQTVVYEEENYTVTQVEVDAFKNCDKITSLTIPASVIMVGDSAFAGCTALMEIYAERRIAPEIGTDVFEDTTEDLVIHVFYNATGYTVENGWTATISYDLGDYVFGRENLIYTITNYGKKEVSVRANVELIEDAVVIPQTVVYEEENYMVTQVEAKAFMDCNKVTSLTIPASVTLIGDSAFVGCTNLAELHAKRLNAPVLGTDVFDGLEEITTVYVKFNATGYTVENGWIVQVIYDEDEQGTSIENIYDNVNVYVINHTLFIENDIEEYIHIYSIYGHSYSFKLNIGVNKLSLPQGIYIVKGKKVIV